MFRINKTNCLTPNQLSDMGVPRVSRGFYCDQPPPPPTSNTTLSLLMAIIIITQPWAQISSTHRTDSTLMEGKTERWRGYSHCYKKTTKKLLQIPWTTSTKLLSDDQAVAFHVNPALVRWAADKLEASWSPIKLLYNAGRYLPHW